MILMAVYVVFVMIGEFIAFGIGYAVERFSEVAGLTAFLAIFFLNFAVCWKLAVWITEPRGPGRRNYWWNAH